MLRQVVGLSLLAEELAQSQGAVQLVKKEMQLFATQPVRTILQGLAQSAGKTVQTDSLTRVPSVLSLQLTEEEQDMFLKALVRRTTLKAVRKMGFSGIPSVVKGSMHLDAVSVHPIVQRQ